MTVETVKVTMCDVCKCDNSMNPSMKFTKLHGFDVCIVCNKTVKQILVLQFKESKK